MPNDDKIGPRVRLSIAVAGLLLLVPSAAVAQSDDPCFDALGDDTAALDAYDALVGEYLDASAASDSRRQVEVLDQLIGICQANLRLYAFRANARVAQGTCDEARQDYAFVLDNAETWPAADNGADAADIASRGLLQAEQICPITPDDTTAADDTAAADGTGATDTTATNGGVTVIAPANDTSADAPVEPDRDSAMVIGLSAGGGMAWTGFDDQSDSFGVDTDPVRGAGGGAQIFVTYQFVDWFGIGGMVRFEVYEHDHDDDDSVRTTFIPSFAPLVRFRATHFVANVWLGVFAGTLELELDLDDDSTATESFDLFGFEVGTFLGYPFEPWSFGTLELGLQVAVRSGTASQSDASFLGLDVTTFEADLTSFQSALALQGTFEIGL